MLAAIGKTVRRDVENAHDARLAQTDAADRPGGGIDARHLLGDALARRGAGLSGAGLHIAAAHTRPRGPPAGR